MNNKYEKLANDFCFKLTSLRKDDLIVLTKAKRPLGAYEILERLRKFRPNAKPPTVYRVLDFFVQKNMVHRIESNNTFILCHLEVQHKHDVSFLLFCTNCNETIEILSTDLSKKLTQLSQKNNICITNNTIEIQGRCVHCFQ